MDKNDFAMSVSYVSIIGWSGLFWSNPSAVLCHVFVWMVVVLALLWGWVAVD